MTIPATGSIVPTESGHDVLIERTFPAPIGDVWRSLTEPERMARWVGTWSGEPGEGRRVTFRMTAEGDDAPAEEVLIHRCQPPRVLDVQTFQGEGSWRLRVDLTEADGVTTLQFRQAVDVREDVASYGVGWEYYLDRLAATLAGEAFADWDAYYPAQLPHWEAEVQRARDASTP